MLTVVAQEGSEKSAAASSGSLLDELVRDGARQMLAVNVRIIWLTLVALSGATRGR